ncbi:MAG TPA: hypothetical protein VKB32_09410 [Actinomycetota bacterium]|nr:hypothetical protein [Actinomycetota bacterium]
MGVVAALVMAMFAMVAAATYQGTGFFTPLYHIASSLIDPATMMRSMEAAASGDAFTFSAGPAAVGVMLHLLTGAFWGAIFGLIVSTGRLKRLDRTAGRHRLRIGRDGRDGLRRTSRDRRSVRRRGPHFGHASARGLGNLHDRARDLRSRPRGLAAR